MLNKIAIQLINRYQRKGGGTSLWVDCNFSPTCSQFGKECYQQFSFSKATKLTFNRIKRCNCRDSIEIINDPVSNYHDKRYKAAEQETERLREEVNKLDPSQRKAYYNELPDILKDQDTYAALNYAFFLSLHHIYVGKYWLFGLNLFLILLIFVNPFFFILWLMFECYQLYELFFSQSIILEENNRRMQALLDKIKSQ